MFHSLPRDFLYSAYFIKSTFAEPSGKEHVFSGTCFFVNSEDGSRPNLVTNRHVVEPQYKDRKWKELTLRHFDVRGYCRVTGLRDIWLKASTSSWIFPNDYCEDVAILPSPQFHALNPSDHNFQPYGLSANLLASFDDFQNTVEICDMLAFPGYPPWFDQNGQRPIIRGGTVASDPRSDYRSAGMQEARRMAYEAFSFGGSSGSPVFALAKGLRLGGGLQGGYFRDIKLVGINGGHLQNSTYGEHQHSGISYLFKSTVILDCLQAADVSTVAALLSS
ncbi:MAG: serine protease [Hyphomicrobium sp.]